MRARRASGDTGVPGGSLQAEEGGEYCKETYSASPCPISTLPYTAVLPPSKFLSRDARASDVSHSSLGHQSYGQKREENIAKGRTLPTPVAFAPSNPSHTSITSNPSILRVLEQGGVPKRTRVKTWRGSVVVAKSGRLSTWVRWRGESCKEAYSSVRGYSRRA